MIVNAIVFMQLILLTQTNYIPSENDRVECFTPDNRAPMLKAAPNCGNQQCFCDSSTARCVGDESTHVLPSLGSEITQIYAQCYKLNNINASTFDNIGKDVETIALKNSQIRQIASNTFRRFHQLKSLSISYNYAVNQTELGEALGSIKQLTNITLRKIELANITDLFYHVNAPNILSVDMTGNNLEGVEIRIFNNLKSLQRLSLARNWIKKVDSNDASPLSSLRYLDLAENQLEADKLQLCGQGNWSEQSLFPNLETLHLEKNRISSDIESLTCVPRIVELYLTGNRMKHVNMSLFSNLSFLKELSFRANWIQNVTPGEFPPNLESIDFGQNELVAFPPELCVNGTNTWKDNNIKRLNFTRNYIQKIMIYRWGCLNNLEALDFSRNDVDVLYNNTFMPLVSLKILYLTNMVPFMKEIQPNAFKTQNDTIESLTVRFNAIDFSKSYMRVIFQACPNVRRLDISYNFFDGLSEADIVGILKPMKNLDKLWAVRISLERFPSLFLTTFKSLTYLDINRNHLDTIVFSDELRNEAFNLSLKVLLVSGCGINTVDEQAFPTAIRNSLEKLDISRNEFACGCKLTWFRDEVTENGYIYNTKLMRWPDDYKCRSPSNLVGELVKDFTPDELCSLLGVVLIAVAVSLVVFCLIVGIVYWKRWYIQYWWFRMIRQRRGTRLTDDDRQPLLNKYNYDGFVVHDEGDDAFVHHKFLDVMEKKLKYNLHVWKRNAQNGSLVDVILDGMDDSRHVIVIVSNKSIKNQWCKFQLNVAIDRSVNLRQGGVLLVVLENTDFRYLSKSWCVLLAKTPQAFWSNDDAIDDVKMKLFEQTVLKHVGSPIRSRTVNGI